MRYKFAGLGMLFLFVIAGCNHVTGLGILRGWRRDDPVPPQGQITSANLVDYLNQNAERVQTLRCTDVQMRAAMGLGLVRHIDLEGSLVCEQPRNFRLVAKLMGKDEVDLGSNQKEFWYWVRRDNPPAQVYCSYDDLDSGQVHVMPFPFQPEWVLETLGMTKYGPPEKYQLKETRDEIRLIERTKSPQGKPVQKVIVFNRREADIKRGEPQIKAFLLIDEQTGKEICSAHIRKAQLDPRNKAILPKQIELRWPEKDVSLTLRLQNPTANFNMATEERGRYFTRRPLDGIPSIDLARLRPRTAQPSSVRRVRGYSQK